MTNIVTGVVITEENAVVITSLTCGVHGTDDPTIIDPSGALVTVILASRAALDTEPAGFSLSSSFVVGDVVEVHDRDIGGNSGPVFDENGNQVSGNVAIGIGVTLRKVATGAGRTWTRTG